MDDRPLKTTKHPEGYRIEGTNLIVGKMAERPRWGEPMPWGIWREGFDECLLEARSKAEALHRAKIIATECGKVLP